MSPLVDKEGGGGGQQLTLPSPTSQCCVCGKGEVKGFGAGHGWAENCKTESDLFGSGPKNSKTFSDFEHKSRQNYFFWTCVRCAFFNRFFLDPRAAGDPFIFLPRAAENPPRLRDASVAYPPPVVREPTPSAHPPGRCAARVEPLAVGAENKVTRVGPNGRQGAGWLFSGVGM